uniref:Protein LIKE COV 2 n=1 Tax=Gossypium raimondii TaxID=29730 RepID=A0A0D2URL2_GOSRA|nr:hypothetical protein B456_011G115000 [Gossypium raimondii]
MAMAEEKESTSIPLSQAENGSTDPEDPAKSPPSSPNSSTRKACCFVLQSWFSKKFMTGCVVLFPVAVTFFITWWFIQFVDGFFSPLYERLGVDIFGLGFITSLLFVFFVGVFVSSWMGAAVFSVGEWVIKQMPFVRHIYSASKQISAAISPDQNTTAFKEVAIIRHPRVGEYAFGFITSTVILQVLFLISSLLFKTCIVFPCIPFQLDMQSWIIQGEFKNVIYLFYACEIVLT